jgi:hypothetical protein
MKQNKDVHQGTRSVEQIIARFFEVKVQDLA